MIFQHTWNLILSGRKTQTRRVMKGDQPPWVVGKSYAVQPGRTKKAVGRIVVTRIWQEALGDISAADAWAEGFDNREAFFETWTRIHGTFDAGVRVWVVEFSVAAG